MHTHVEFPANFLVDVHFVKFFWSLISAQNINIVIYKLVIDAWKVDKYLHQSPGFFLGLSAQP